MEHKHLRFGLYNDNFKMSFPEVLEQRIIDVRNTPSLFEIKMGPMVFNNHTFESTYVLEIHYMESEDRVASKLFLNGFGSHLCDKFGEQANKIAEDFIKKHDLVLNTHLNSWPVYQSIVSEKNSAIEQKETKNKLMNYCCDNRN